MSAETDSAVRAAVRERFLRIPSSVACDALDDLGLRKQGLDPAIGAFSGQQLAGWAYTIQGVPRASEARGDPVKMQAASGVGPGEVAVWAGGGGGTCYFGELIALGMAERGCVGALLDGGVRDLDALEEMSFPTFARYRSPVQAIGRWQVTSWQVPVTFPGATGGLVTVAPEDFVLADGDGAVCIPAVVVREVLDISEAQVAVEDQIRKALRGGSTLAQCLEEFGHV